MRFLTQYPGLHTQVRPQRQQGRGDGTVEVLVPGLYVKAKSIQQGAFIYENEIQLALKHFTFHGNTQDAGEAIPTDPMARLAVFDTDELAQEEGWTEDDKELVESWLSRHAIDAPSELLFVDSQPIAAPFPNFDSWEGDATKLAIKLIEDGHDLQTVYYYETTFGLKRPDVIAALEQAIEIEKEHTVTA